MESFQDVKVLIEVAKSPTLKTLSHTYKPGQWDRKSWYATERKKNNPHVHAFLKSFILVQGLVQYYKSMKVMTDETSWLQPTQNKKNR